MSTLTISTNATMKRQVAAAKVQDSPFTADRSLYPGAQRKKSDHERRIDFVRLLEICPTAVVQIIVDSRDVGVKDEAGDDRDPRPKARPGRHAIDQQEQRQRPLKIGVHLVGVLARKILGDDDKAFDRNAGISGDSGPSPKRDASPRRVLHPGSRSETSGRPPDTRPDPGMQKRGAGLHCRLRVDERRQRPWLGQGVAPLTAAWVTRYREAVEHAPYQPKGFPLPLMLALREKMRANPHWGHELNLLGIQSN